MDEEVKNTPEYKEARAIIDAEWENINAFHGNDLKAYLMGLLPGITEPMMRMLWMEYYGIVNDPTLGQF